MCNRGGVEPEGIEELTRIARRVRPDVVVWRGDQNLPPSEQSLKVLGCQLATVSLSRNSWMARKSREQVTLFQRIPWIEDTQAVFASPHVWFDDGGQFNPTKRRISRGVTTKKCGGVCARLWEHIQLLMKRYAGLVSAGGLELTSAQRVKGAAHFASWADCLHMVRDRDTLIPS